MNYHREFFSDDETVYCPTCDKNNSFNSWIDPISDRCEDCLWKFAKNELENILVSVMEMDHAEQVKHFGCRISDSVWTRVLELMDKDDLVQILSRKMGEAP